ncbi:MAG: glycosyltransferase family 2 protein [Anaerolineae bacterium]|nr:glycosyltransferase family 2 protein [Anaerolineae bacterium]
MDFSVIICAYSDERWEDICAAIDSLARQTLHPVQIIVVIDHAPELLERVTARFNQVVVIANRHERGLSGARNTGIDNAHADIVAFMDDDATAAADWLEMLAGCFVDPNVIGAGGQVVPRWDCGRPSWFPSEFDWVVGCTYKGMPQSTSPIRNLIGCNMSFRKDVFEHIGGFQSHIGRIGKLPVGCEETELCIRAQQKWPPAQIIFEPSAIVYHRVPSERATWRYFMRRCFSEGISKVLVSREVGAGAGLASERTYAIRTLPLGVLSGIADTVFRLDIAGLARAIAIIVGLMTTTAGYVSALISKRIRARGTVR